MMRCLSIEAYSQIKTYAPARSTPEKNARKSNAPLQVAASLSLPFWDDFSAAVGHPDDALWVVNNTVFVNNGQAINPPSINVATFDGYNEAGVPYSSDPLETGNADVLESQPILLGATAVPVADQPNVYLSFFYQPGGNSEMPNPSDYLKLEFKSSNKGWVEIYRFRTISNQDPTVFYDTAIQIPQAVLPDDPQYFHDDFQFRFSSFGRLSGSYDAWHLDYVYLNKRIFNDKNTNISDRTLADPLTSVFGKYQSIPYDHFKQNKAEHLAFQKFEVFNLKDTLFIIGGIESDEHILSYDYSITVNNYQDHVLISSIAEPAQTDITIDKIHSRERRAYEIDFTKPGAKPSILSFHEDADSVIVFSNFLLRSGDNVEYDEGDYDSKRYNPIDFKVNDTELRTFTLASYYAYDDGTAEYAAGLAAQGNQLAYRFIMDEGIVDVLNGVDIYFPFTGGTTPETIQLFVFKDKAGKPDSMYWYTQLANVTRTANSLFTTIKFNKNVQVQDTFYIGYQETITGSQSRIRIGLDASNDTGEDMYYRNTVYHPWLQNDEVKGSLMIRPRYGEATLVTGIEKEKKTTSIYPNPNKGEFYLKGRTEDIQIISLTGQPVKFSFEQISDTKKITLQGAVPGLYIVRYRSGSSVFADKIIVKEY